MSMSITTPWAPNFSSQIYASLIIIKSTYSTPVLRYSFFHHILLPLPFPSLPSNTAVFRSQSSLTRQLPYQNSHPPNPQKSTKPFFPINQLLLLIRWLFLSYSFFSIYSTTTSFSLSSTTYLLICAVENLTPTSSPWKCSRKETPF